MTKIFCFIEKRRKSKNIFWKNVIRLKDRVYFAANVCSKIARNSRIFLFPSIMQMKRLDKNKIPDDKYNKTCEIRAFVVVRNEKKRLPYFFKYYSSKGVDRFFIVDNGSYDGTLEYCLSRKNTHVFQTYESYRKADYGLNWDRILLKKYGIGHWCLILDADEIFIYPYYEQLSLKDLCKFLEKEKSTSVKSFLIDMYSKKPLYKSRITSGRNPLEEFNYFDQSMIRMARNKSYDCYDPKYSGGVRKRVFGLDSGLRKNSLLKYEKNVLIDVGYHCVYNTKPSALWASTLHFKYDSGLAKYAESESGREEYWDGASEYKKMNKVLSKKTYLSLYTKESIKLIDSMQLVNLRIMQTSREFEKFVQEIKMNDLQKHSRK